MINKEKIIFLLFLSLTNCLLFGQTDFKFYKSVEDYANDKFVPGYDIVERSWGDSDFSSESLKIKINGKEKKIIISDFPADFYSASEGSLWRRFNKESYIILAYGPYCYYAAPGFSKDPEYYSETISGPVEKFKQGWFEKRLKEKGLLEAYKKDRPKREFKDGVNQYFNKLVQRNIKYFKLLNATT